MLEPRVIPILLLKNSGLYKTKKFNNPKYVGDPINTVKIFNDKEVDELVLFDINASLKNEIQFDLLKEIASEAFMPLCYGGGIKNINQIEKIFGIGFEKVCINNNCLKNFELIKESSRIFGSQSIVVCIDIKKDFFGRYSVFSYINNELLKISPVEHIEKCITAGAGEIILQFVDRDGQKSGYDIKAFEKLTKSIEVPLVIAGGASSIEDFKNAFTAGATGAAAGAMFVFQGPHDAVLIQYPKRSEMEWLNHDL